jgi:hypothetical protein
MDTGKCIFTKRMSRRQQVQQNSQSKRQAISGKDSLFSNQEGGFFIGKVRVLCRAILPITGDPTALVSVFI